MNDKVIFLDRDGTINKEINYLYRIDDFEFTPNAIDAIKIFHRVGYKVIVITNQAGVAKGYYNEQDINVLHGYLDELLKKNGTYIDAYYYCPHHPNGSRKEYSIKCKCRKPNTGLIEKAETIFEINRLDSIIVGDKETDILTGVNAGIGTKVLLSNHHLIVDGLSRADYVYENLFCFALALSCGYLKI